MNSQDTTTLQPPSTASASDLNDFLWQSATARPGAKAKPRRQDPRVHVLLPVRLQHAKGRKLTVMLHDISLTGFQIRCDGKLFEQLGVSRLDDGQTAKQVMALSRDLPLTSASQNLKAAGRVVHVTEIDSEPPRSRFAVGFEFEQFENGSEAILARYVEEQLVPAGWDYD